MCAGFLSIICALTVEAIRYERFMSIKSNSVAYINKLHLVSLYAVDIPVGIMIPQFIVQAVAECLVLITSKLNS